jgi:Phosphoribosylformylglycinamidine (FGAM) synthase, PurS component
LKLRKKDEQKAEKKIHEMCEKLLVNLIIEDFKINKLK